MQLTKKQTEFWTILFLVILGVSTVVLIIDYTIKAAILEESTKLRLKIEEWQNGPKDSGTVPVGTTPNADFNPSNDSDILVVRSPGMEERSHPNGLEKTDANTSSRRPKSHRQTDPRAIPPGNQ